MRLLVLNVPHNPTGVAATADELRTIVARCDELGIRIVGDEVYRGLEWTGATPPSVTELSDRAVCHQRHLKDVRARGPADRLARDR